MWHECRIWRAKLDTNRPFELTGLLGRIIFKQTFRKRQDERSHMKLFNTVVPSLSDPNLLPSHNPSIKIPNLKDSKPLVSVQWHHPFGGGGRQTKQPKTTGKCFTGKFVPAYQSARCHVSEHRDPLMGHEYK